MVRVRCAPYRVGRLTRAVSLDALLVLVHPRFGVPPALPLASSSVVSFFFSSRRRHTRLVSDWSSDVCSSDLVGDQAPHTIATRSTARAWSPTTWTGPLFSPSRTKRANASSLIGAGNRPIRRSEERRVGKEGRSRW